jgi:hypothetical protein
MLTVTEFCMLSSFALLWSFSSIAIAVKISVSELEYAVLFIDILAFHISHILSSAEQLIILIFFILVYGSESSIILNKNVHFFPGENYHYPLASCVTCLN